MAESTDPEAQWTDPVEEGATFAPIRPSTENLYDYEVWAQEDRGWRKLVAAIRGGAAIGTLEGSQVAADRVSPRSLLKAAEAFEHVYELLSWLETKILDQSRAIAGPERAWQGAAADAFLSKMETFSDWLGKHAERIGGMGGPDSVPSQLYHSGNYLAWAQEAIHSIDVQFAALSYAQDPARKGPDGNIAISGTEFEKPMAEFMRDVVREVAEQYDFTVSKVRPAPDQTPPVSTPSLPSVTTPPVPSLTTPPPPSVSAPPPPRVSTPPPTPGVSVPPPPPRVSTPPSVSVPPPPPRVSTPPTTPTVSVPPPPPSIAPPPPRSVGPLPSITPPVTPPIPTPPPTFPGPVGGAPIVTPPNRGAGGGTPFPTPPSPSGGGGGLPGLGPSGPNRPPDGAPVVPPQLPPSPGNSGNVVGGGRDEPDGGVVNPVVPPPPSAGGGLEDGVTIPGLPGSGANPPAGGGLGPGGMPMMPGPAGGGAPGGGGGGQPESPDAKGLLGDQEDWALDDDGAVKDPSAPGGVLPGGAGLGTPTDLPGVLPGGFPAMPGSGAPGGGTGIPETPDARGLISGDPGDWQPGEAGGDGPDAPAGVPAGGVGLDLPSVPAALADRIDPAATIVAPLPVGVPQVAPPPPTGPAEGTGRRRDPDHVAGAASDGAPGDGTPGGEPSPPAAPEVPLAVSAYGLSVPGIGPQAPQPFAVAGGPPGRPPTDDAGEREKPERPRAAELLEEAAGRWGAGPEGSLEPPGDDHVPVIPPGDDDPAGWDDIAGSWWLTDGDEERDQEGRLTDA